MDKTILLRPDYADLAKKTNSACAAVSTVFLFTRIWARTTQYKGLWWDDYILIAAWAVQLVYNGLHAAAPAYGFNIINSTPHGWVIGMTGSTALYLSIALSKTAFATTLLRLSSGGLKVVLCVVVAVNWFFAVALATLAWLQICEQKFEIGISAGACVSLNTYILLQIGNAVSTVLIDMILAYLPWRVVSKYHLPGKERYGVCASMSLTGLAGVICVTRIAISSHFDEFSKNGQDFTYGAYVVTGMMGFEIVVYIIAQTVPLLRVLWLGDSISRQDSVVELRHGTATKSKTTPASASVDMLTGGHENMELVALPSGKIVRADSEEGRAFRASQPPAEDTAAQPAANLEERTVADDGDGNRNKRSTTSADDHVHELWADMGLSRRVWSLPPSSSRAREGESSRRPLSNI